MYAKNLALAILLSGGACSTMDMTVRSLAEEALTRGYKVYGFVKGWYGLMFNQVIELTLDNYKNIILQSCTKMNVFNYKGGNYVKECKKTYDSLNIQCIFAIGGDGTIRQANDLSKYGMNFINIPSTLDRDIIGCNKETAGFWTAVDQSAQTIIAMAKDGYKMGRSVLIQIAGRLSGAVTLYAVAKAIKKVNVDFVFIPGKKYDFSDLAKEMNKKDCVLVMSEGMDMEGFGNEILEVGNHVDLSSKGLHFANKIAEITGKKVKLTVVDYRMRMANPVHADINLVYKFNEIAWQEFDAGKRNFSVVSDLSYGIIPLYQMAILNQSSDLPKLISPDDSIWDQLGSVKY